MYTVYTDNQVFANGNANIACNLLHQALIDEFGESPIADNFFLTGWAASIIQGEDSEAVNVISFGTANDSMFVFCAQELAKKINASGSVLFTDQIQMIYNDTIFIEIWHIDPIAALVVVDDIVMQNKANIPSFIKTTEDV